MSTIVYRISVLLSAILADVPVGTNLGRVPGTGGNPVHPSEEPACVHASPVRETPPAPRHEEKETRGRADLSSDF